MLHLLFTMIFLEATLIMILSFKTPFRKMAILTLDKVKRGRGPIIVKTVAGTIFMVLLSSVYGMMEIQNHSVDAAPLNPTDQVIMARHLLEASLMGFTLFLALIIDRIHHYIRELRLLRKSMQALKDNQSFGDKKANVSEPVS